MEFRISELTFTMTQDPLLQDLVQLTEAFPAPPAILSKILKLTEDPATPIDRIVEALSADPAIAAKVLKQSNSAFYGRTRSIASIREAVVMLGYYTIRSLVVATAAHSLYLQESEFRSLRHKMWEHSLATAIFARLLAREYEGFNPEEAYIAGLLHDVGKLLIVDRWPEHFTRILQAQNQQPGNAIDMETELFGFSHPMAGAVLMDRWLFPEQLISPVALHHEHLPLSDLAGIVSMANRCVSLWGYNILLISEEETARMNEPFLLERRGEFEEMFLEQKGLFENP